MKGLVTWTDRHRDEIASRDAKHPRLLQLDLLVDWQLREAFRSMDRCAQLE